MMTLEMYSIKDEADGFTPPIPLTSERVAIRWYLTMRETNIDMKTNPNDFTLWKIGEFDKDDGTWTEDRREIDV